MITVRKINLATESFPNPPAGRMTIYLDENGALKKRDDLGSVTSLAGLNGSNGAGFVRTVVANAPLVVGNTNVAEVVVGSVLIPSSVLIAGDAIAARVACHTTTLASGVNATTMTMRARCTTGANAGNVLAGSLIASESRAWSQAYNLNNRARIVEFIGMVESIASDVATISGTICEYGASAAVAAGTCLGFSVAVNVSTGLALAITQQSSAAGWANAYKPFVLNVQRTAVPA